MFHGSLWHKKELTNVPIKLIFPCPASQWSFVSLGRPDLLMFHPSFSQFHQIRTVYKQKYVWYILSSGIQQLLIQTCSRQGSNKKKNRYVIREVCRFCFFLLLLFIEKGRIHSHAHWQWCKILQTNGSLTNTFEQPGIVSTSFKGKNLTQCQVLQHSKT